jgi:hypothetical protein
MEAKLQINLSSRMPLLRDPSARAPNKSFQLTSWIGAILQFRSTQTPSRSINVIRSSGQLNSAVGPSLLSSMRFHRTSVGRGILLLILACSLG